MRNWLKVRFIAGIFVTLPAIATAWILWIFWSWIDDRFAPIYERVSEKHPDVTFGKVDTEAQLELQARYDIRSIPTIMAIRDGVIVVMTQGQQFPVGFPLGPPPVDAYNTPAGRTNYAGVSGACGNDAHPADPDVAGRPNLRQYEGLMTNRKQNALACSNNSDANGMRPSRPKARG